MSAEADEVMALITDGCVALNITARPLAEEDWMKLALHLALKLAATRRAVSRGFTQGRFEAPAQAPGEKLGSTREAVS